MKNILFISHSGKAGGAERVLSYSINHTFNDCSKYNRFVIYPKFQGENFKELLDIKNIQVKSVFYRANSSNTLKSIICNLINIPAIIYLVYFCLIKRINIIYVNSSVNFIGAILSVLTGKKIIWHIHEQSNQRVKIIPNYMRGIYRKLLTSKNIFSVFVSRRNKCGWEKELSVDLKESKVIYPPIRKNKGFHQTLKTTDEICFGYLGAFVKEKNIILLVESFRDILNNARFSKSKLKLILGGSGVLLDEIVMKCEEFGIINRVEIMEYSDDVSLFFSKIDILVQPSFNESWGLVALEALFYRKALILTKESGLVEILDDGVDCIFVNPFNKEDLVAKMTCLLENISMQVKLSENGYRKFLSQNFNGTYDDAMQSLLYKIDHFN